MSIARQPRALPRGRATRRGRTAKASRAVEDAGSPFTLGYSKPELVWSDVASGAIALTMALCSLG
ncbi:MAG TPA: hypothetical protein VGL19_15385, partial [Polyangiaceae bacterium]